MLKVDNLDKYYGNNLGVKNIKLDLNSGEVFGFIGPNGAGKSTTIRGIMNLIKKNNGSIYIDGKEIKFNDYKYRENIGYLPSEVNLYDNMKVMEMLEYAKSFYKKDCSKKIEELVKLFKIDVNKKIGELSLGNKKKIGLVIALMTEAKLLILDEATSGLDPIMQNTLFDILKKYKEKGTTILFSTHNLNEIKKICDRVAIIKNGSIISVEEVNKICSINYSIVSIVSNEVKKIELDGNMIIKEISKDKVVLLYTGDINNLIKKIGKINIRNILIEEIGIDEIFMHYYK